MIIIAGPCVIEREETVLEIAHELKRIRDSIGLPIIFKASFDKGNRSSHQSYRGPGIDKGMDILEKVKKQTKLPITTDIHEPWQAEIAADVCDVLQVPAFLCRQTDLLAAAANTGWIVNVKKGQFMSGADMENVIDKVEASTDDEVCVWLTERGNSFGYNRLVVDYTNILEMHTFGCPIIFDATHSVQLPGGNGKSSGGNRRYVEPLAKAAVAVGVDGLFFETHPNPKQALSDGPNMIPLYDFEEVLRKVVV